MGAYKYVKVSALSKKNYKKGYLHIQLYVVHCCQREKGTTMNAQETLRYLLKLNHISQNELARRCDIPQQYVSKALTRKSITTKTLHKFLKYIGYKIYIVPSSKRSMPDCFEIEE